MRPAIHTHTHISVQMSVIGFNPSECKDNSATYEFGTLAVDGRGVTFGTARRGLGGTQPAHALPRCTKCNSPPIHGQCTNHRIAV